ncbi:LETM1 domain-containing protein mdm28, mitochondrial [Golovinomyces cichoracearum]|uniref:LETM1 domain-containing protein mdm28, mitochondrial n=1 Tax=Golovinomyces cichoracearum TaxID=62708 RepID=A0A420IIC0_9PEZI|nr:LETM1 domain-containing protein mdm28, mitochondrial [Golovinomyces cichoracearum]
MSSSVIIRNAASYSFQYGRVPKVSLLPTYLTFRMRSGHRFPSNQTALALLLPIRTVSNNTHTHSKLSSELPPGFNAEQARKSTLSNQLKSTNTSTKGEDVTKIRGVETTSSIKVSAASRLDDTDSSTLTEVTKKGKNEDNNLVSEEKSMTLLQKIKKEARHYWDGTKLLATEIKISTRLASKMAAGYELSRREHKQLRRTVKDIARLVPFSVFVLVPFAELLLPVALKLFPNMLPSTYEGQKSKDTKATNLRTTRKEVSNFLRDTLKETGLPLSPAAAQRDEFTQFFRKLRATGEPPSPDEVIKVCTIFKDDLTLDNLSRPQLVGMCRYMNLNTFGTDMMLRYQIRHRMRQIKRDDRAISFEGVDSLSVPELQVACMSRGLRTHGVSPSRLRDDLQIWLDLRLRHGVPSTLLVLSNAFMYAQGKSDSEFHSQIDALTGVLSSIPEELFHEIELEVHNAEGAATNKQRLEVLKEQQELIEEENEQDEENKESGRSTPRDDENIDEREERRADANVTNVEFPEQIVKDVGMKSTPAEGEKTERIEKN